MPRVTQIRGQAATRHRINTVTFIVAVGDMVIPATPMPTVT